MLSMMLVLPLGWQSVYVFGGKGWRQGLSLRQPCGTIIWGGGGGGGVVTSKYFHRKPVLSTLDRLGKPKTHTCNEESCKRHGRQDQPQQNTIMWWWFGMEGTNSLIGE